MLETTERDEGTDIPPAVRVVAASGSSLQRSEWNPPQFGQLAGQNLLSGFIVPGQTCQQGQDLAPHQNTGRTTGANHTLGSRENKY